MRSVWRLCKKKYAATAFDGEGASKFGNRWNSKGVRMAYTAAHLSLATLEYYAPAELAAFGDRWIAAAETVALALPSIIIPQDCNILLNPLHPDFAKLIFVPPEPFKLDERLLEQLTIEE